MSIEITRRGLLAAATATTIGAPAAALAAAAARARGRVIDDRGGAVPGTLVTNGRDVVACDAAGAWALPFRPGDSLSVIKPTGWMVPVEHATQLPRHAWAHGPATLAGTPPRYPGVAPTGDPPPSLDFVLHRQAEPTAFDAWLITDPQPEDGDELDHVRDDIVARAAALRGATGPAFGLTLGDVMFDDLSMYDRSNRLFATLGVPWWNVCGNHDMNHDAPDNARSRETFRRVFGARRAAFQWGGVTFVLLDNVEFLPGDTYRGAFGDEQLGFVRALLAHLPTDAPVVLCMHIPLRTLAGTDPASACVDTAAFLDAIASHPDSVSFSGHTHTNEHHRLGPAAHHHHVLSAASGSWWSGDADARGVPLALASDGAPNGLHILSVRDGRVRTRLVPAHEPADTGLRLMVEHSFHDVTAERARGAAAGVILGGSLPAASLEGATLLANVFDGRADTIVRVSVDGGPAMPMARVERLDPFVQLTYWAQAPTMKHWVKPTICAHLWAIPLRELGPGTHRIDVAADDPEVSGTMIVEAV